MNGKINTRPPGYLPAANAQISKLTEIRNHQPMAEATACFKERELLKEGMSHTIHSL